MTQIALWQQQHALSLKLIKILSTDPVQCELKLISVCDTNETLKFSCATRTIN